MDPSLHFNSDESFLSEYYLNPANSSWIRNLGAHLACLFVSLGFLALFLAKDDPAWVTIAYVIVAVQMFRMIRAMGRWQPAARGMVAKYEAKIAELTAALEKYEKADSSPPP